MSKDIPHPPAEVKTRNIRSVYICTCKKTVNTSSGSSPLKSCFIPLLGVPRAPFVKAVCLHITYLHLMLQKTHHIFNISIASILTTSLLPHYQKVSWVFTFSLKTLSRFDCRPLEARDLNSKPV